VPIRSLDVRRDIAHIIHRTVIQCVRRVAVHLGYDTQIWLSVTNLPLKYAVVSLYSVVK
jgi:hypothetical protein